MTSLASRVLAAIRRHQLIASDASVVAAVSGGADSVAMVHVLAELAKAGALRLAGLAHLNHQLRASDSDRDEAFCRALADGCGVPFDVERYDVASIAARPGRSLEEAAREVRYAFLERARLRLGADLVAVAHTLDDQAETVLLRLLSGAGTRGLGAMRPRRDTIVRPLLDIRRHQLRAYLARREVPFVEDASNVDRTRRRNRLRHDVIPHLVAAEGEAAIEALARVATIAQADEAALSALTDEAARRVIVTADAVALDAARLAAEPLALRRRLIARVAQQWTGRPASFRQIDALVRFLERGSVGRVPLAGGRMELSPDGRVLFSRGQPQSVGPPSWHTWSYALAVPGELEIPEAAGVLRVMPGAADASSSPGTGLTVQLKSEVVGASVVVRPWKPGDRVRLPYGWGRKKVQDIFVDRKVPRAERHAIPLVVAENGQILWVPGHAVAGGAAAGPATKSVVVLSFEPFGRRST
jgi:tRNA(Ile)-lysidine synthase